MQGQLDDTNVRGAFRINSSTTATINDHGEVAIRQVRKAVHPPPGPGEIATYEPVEVVVKLAADDFALVGRMVAALKVTS